MSHPFIEYLGSLRPDQLARIKHAWKVSAARIEADYPPIRGWTRTHTLARLITAGVFASHPLEGTTPLVAAVRHAVREREFRAALAGDLGRLEGVLRAWAAFIPEGAPLDHAALLRALCNWDHPKRPVQHAWNREYFRRSL